jgi:hypothetical protein
LPAECRSTTPGPQNLLAFGLAEVLSQIMWEFDGYDPSLSRSASIGNRKASFKVSLGAFGFNFANVNFQQCVFDRPSMVSLQGIVDVASNFAQEFEVGRRRVRYGEQFLADCR